MACMGNGEWGEWSLRRDQPTVSITPVLLVIAISGGRGTLHSTVVPVLCKVLLLQLYESITEDTPTPTTTII